MVVGDTIVYREQKVDVGLKLLACVGFESGKDWLGT